MNSRLRYCIITCFDPDDRQFRGICDICSRMGEQPEISHRVWGTAEGTIGAMQAGGDEDRAGALRTGRAGRLDLSRYRELQWVALSGHGEEDMPQMSNGGDPRERIFGPTDIAVGKQTRLYLLGCFQGKPSIRKAWAEGVGVPLENVFGCEEDTETAVSTLFFLNLAEDGCASIGFWFRRWKEVNAGLRPYFPEMRLIYRHNGGDFIETLSVLSRRIDLTPYADFLEAGKRNPACVTGLI